MSLSSQSDQFIFDDLQHLSKDDLLKLSPSEVLLICINEVKTGEHPSGCAFDFALNFLCYDRILQDVGKNVLQAFTTDLFNHISRILKNTGDDDLQSFSNIITNLRKMASVVEMITVQVDSSLIFIVLELNLSILIEWYTFFQNRIQDLDISKKSEQNLNVVFTNCQELHRSIINIVVNNADILRYSNAIDCSVTNKFLDLLCSVGEFISLVDVKITADTWKCISRLGTNCSEYVKSENVATPWLSHAIQFLCNEITQSIHVILENVVENDAQSFAKMERILKVNSFFVKIITKFLIDYGSQHFDGFNSFIQLCLYLNSFRENSINHKVAQSIRQHLTIGVNSLLSEMFKSPKFEQSLCAQPLNDPETFLGFCNVAFQVFELIVISTEPSINDIYFHRRGPTIMSCLLETKHTHIILKKDIYEKLISTTTAAILSLCYNKDLMYHIENNLINGIIGLNFTRCFICCDIMCALFRFATDNLRRNYFKMFLNLYLMSPVFSSHPSVAVLEFLLRNFYTISSDSQKARFIEEYKIQKINLNTRTKLALISDGYKSEQNFNEKDGNVNSSLERLLLNPTKEAYYTLAQNFVTSQLNCEGASLYHIENLWIYLLENRSLCNNILAKGLSMFLLCRRTKFRHIELLNNVDLTSFPKVIRLCLIKLFVLINENEVKNIKSDISKLPLSCNERLLLTITCSSQYTGTKPSSYNSKCLIPNDVMETFFQLIVNYQLKHSCKLKKTFDDSTDDSNPSKRSKVEKIHTECPLLLDAKLIADQMKAYFKHNACSDEDLIHIRYIGSIFDSLSKNRHK